MTPVATAWFEGCPQRAGPREKFVPRPGLLAAAPLDLGAVVRDRFASARFVTEDTRAPWYSTSEQVPT